MKELKAYAIIDETFEIAICTLDVRASIKNEARTLYRTKPWAIFGTRKEARECLAKSMSTTAKVICITIS